MCGFRRAGQNFIGGSTGGYFNKDKSSDGYGLTLLDTVFLACGFFSENDNLLRDA